MPCKNSMWTMVSQKYIIGYTIIMSPSDYHIVGCQYRAIKQSI